MNPPTIENLIQLQALELGNSPDSADRGEIDKLRKKIPSPVLKHYDRRRSVGKKGVALVHNGVCGQCHMQVSSGLRASLLRRDGDLHCCQNCGAYLSIVDEAPAEIPVKPAKIRAKVSKRALLT